MDESLLEKSETDAVKKEKAAWRPRRLLRGVWG
jgi:hypothetical protein